MIKRLILLILAGIFQGCQTHYCSLEPELCYPLTAEALEELPSSFAPLASEEKETDWGKEMVIGSAFARELDFYRAIGSYKRARILMPIDSSRLSQVEYSLILCYYLGQKYEEAIANFEQSSLVSARSSFPAYRNLLILLYDSYQKIGDEEKAEQVRDLIQKHDPYLAEDLALSTALERGDIPRLEEETSQVSSHPGIAAFLSCYHAEALSPVTARVLNAVLPGAGYYYVGQKKSAVTSFLLNTLFLWATVRFFERGYVAAGIITGSLEVGWYLGGINGAGLAAKEYNEYLYNNYGREAMACEKLFPILLFSQVF